MSIIRILAAVGGFYAGWTVFAKAWKSRKRRKS
jgi:hypothetical protein